MKAISLKTLLGVFAGFAAGIAVSTLPAAWAASSKVSEQLSKKTFDVTIFEVKQTFTADEWGMSQEFTGSYTKTVTLSDGKQRTIELVPMIHDGMRVVQLKDTGGMTYMGLNGTTLNGNLLVQLSDLEAVNAQLKADGWPLK